MPKYIVEYDEINRRRIEVEALDEVAAIVQVTEMLQEGEDEDSWEVDGGPDVDSPRIIGPTGGLEVGLSTNSLHNSYEFYFGKRSWEQACDWVDDIIERHPDQDDAAPFPALQIYEREMLEAERCLDEYEDQQED